MCALWVYGFLVLILIYCALMVWIEIDHSVRDDPKPSSREEVYRFRRKMQIGVNQLSDDEIERILNLTL